MGARSGAGCKLEGRWKRRIGKRWKVTAAQSACFSALVSAVLAVCALQQQAVTNPTSRSFLPVVVAYGVDWGKRQLKAGIV